MSALNAVALVEYVADGLVAKPDEIRIDEIPGHDEVIIELRVAEEDVGKVIGKNGSVARAMRTLLTAIGTHDEKTYVLEIID
ncbi:MAG: KH domain-containing protein [Spirochaetia bacterium]|nr:KH domain-containing protein [Spirochaetia bacterium]